jgi:zinc D-Ala-D-Ala dipeptidase
MPMSLFDLAYEVPIRNPEAYAGSAASISLDTTDPRWNEPLVRLDSVGVAYEAYHARTDGRNWPYFAPVPGAQKEIWLRKTVAGMLAKVNDRLEPFGVELMVWHGYRPLACQQGLWDFHYREAARTLSAGTPAAWRAQARLSVCDPGDFDENDPATWPAHTTGAAVDLSLRDRDSRNYCDLGGRFDDFNDVAATDYFERQLAAGEITHNDTRLRYRRLLHWALSGEGFENEPVAYWHYDWGSPLYVEAQALREGPAKAAWYGYIASP